MKKQFATSTILLFLFSMSAFGITYELNSPSIWSSDVDGQQREKLVSIQNYMSDELKFLDGMEFTNHSQQGFNGTSAQVSHFIAMLIEAGIWKVRVKFHNYGEQNTAFRTGQKSPNSINITVNSGRDDFLLKNFAKYLPQLELPKQDHPKAEENDAELDAPVLTAKQKRDTNQSKSRK